MLNNKVIVGNWKMNGTIANAEAFLEKFMTQNFNDINNEVVICPPFTLLYLFKQKLAQTPILLGAQDSGVENMGAFTGDISPSMLKDMGCKYVILGHSERRIKHYETNYLINKKANLALENNLIPIICVGESKTDKEEGKTKEVVSKQVKFSLPKNFNASNVIIAYEPVWSIGSGNLPTKEEIVEVIEEIKQTLASLTNKDLAENLKVLYGGSVNANNGEDLLSIPQVGGILVGGASLKVEEFMTLINSNKDNI